MATDLILSLREGVAVEPDPTGRVAITGPGYRTTISPPRQVWFALAAGATEAELYDQAAAEDGAAGVARFVRHIRALIERGSVVRSIALAGNRLATLEPTSPGFRPAKGGLDASRAHVLSRFAYLHSVHGRMVLESPLAHARVVLHDGRAAALVHALGKGGKIADLVPRVGGLPSDAVERVMGLLAEAGLIRECDSAGRTAEDALPLDAWEFHDLLFHFRSRDGRHDAPIGGIFRHAGRYSPPPTGRPPRVNAIELPTLDLAAIERNDLPFATVVERRRSVREYATNPIAVDQLAEFLYRVGRVRSTWEQEMDTAAGPVTLGFTSRPYPAGGCLYEMELYPVVRRCAGLDPGVYRYDPFGHRLESAAGPGVDHDVLLDAAARAASIPPGSIQVLVVLAARFHRVSWKYASLAYALVLKHVGVLYQTMYLTATAMGLAPCALGAGNPDLFAAATGTDPYVEPSVGEFLLGLAAAPS